MVIEPLGIQAGNYGVEILAQTSKSSLAQAQQTAEMNQILKDNYRKSQEIQHSDEIMSSEKVHRKNDDEQKQDREREQEDKKKSLAQQEEEEGAKTAARFPIQKNGRYDFYV